MDQRSKFVFQGLGLLLLLGLSAGAQAQKLPPMEIGVGNSFITLTGQAPKDANEAEAQADRLIATQYATGEFESLTGGMQVKIQHKKTGVICDTPGMLIVSPPTEIETLSAARKFTCVNLANGMQNDLTITANNYRLNVDRALAAVIAEARAETPRLNYYPARVSWEERIAPNPGDLQRAGAGLSTGDKPDSRYFYVSVLVWRDWIIADSVRGTLAHRDEVDAVGKEMMRRAIRDVRNSH